MNALDQDADKYVPAIPLEMMTPEQLIVHFRCMMDELVYENNHTCADALVDIAQELSRTHGLTVNVTFTKDDN